MSNTLRNISYSIFLICALLNATFGDNNSCKTPDHVDGLCRLPKTCPSLFSIMTTKPVSQINQKFLRDSVCGSSEGKPMVCCPLEEISTTETVELEVPKKEIKSRLDLEVDECKTPSQANGSCQLLKECKVLFDMFSSKPISAENINFLKESRENCGMSDGKPLFCCPTESPGIEHPSCITSNSTEGSCKPPKACEIYWNIIQNKPISSENIALLKSNVCGTSSETNQKLLCCPPTVLSRFRDSEFFIALIDYEPCNNPNNVAGECKPLYTCPALFEIMNTKPISSQNKLFLKQSKCATGDNGKPWICCALPPKPKPIPPTKPTPTTTVSPIGKSCRDGKEKHGTCVQLKTCSKLFTMATSKPVSAANREFLIRSQCAYLNRLPYVCCAHEQESDVTTTTAITLVTTPRVEIVTNIATTSTTEAAPEIPDWLKKLKSFLPAAPECGFDAQDRIFGGKETKIDEFPWTVLLEYTKPDNTKGFHCGGSLINQRYVLTVAHCVRKIDASWNLISVRLGEWNLETEKDCDPDEPTHCASPVIDNRIAQIIYHPKYRPNSKNQHYDIALLRLARNIDYKNNDFIKPICLPLDPALWEKDYAGFTLDVVGWGKTESASQSNIKLTVKLPFVSEADCKRKYTGKEIIGTQICAGGKKGEDSCNGDSGGPLMHFNTDHGTIPQWLLVGMVSFGAAECGNEGVPGVYTRVSSYLKWISENIRK